MNISPIELITSTLIVVILILFVNPFMILMPSTVLYMALAGLIILVAIFVGLVWREHTNDEREELHRFVASRFAYIVGIVILTIGVALESLGHTPNVWLVSALGAMVLAKLVGHLYSRSRL